MLCIINVNKTVPQINICRSMIRKFYNLSPIYHQKKEYKNFIPNIT